MRSKIVRCPQCGVMAEYKIDNPARPFCSKRCKLLDLGAWAEERYSIAGPSVLTESTESLQDDAADHSMDTLISTDRSDRRLDS